MTGNEVRELLIGRGIVLSELSEKLNISPQTLNSRLNAKYFKEEYLKEINQIINISSFKDNNYRLVPLYSHDVVGGINNQESDSNGYITGYIPFVNAQNTDIAVPVTNDSMSPSYEPGSIVQIRKIELWKEFIDFGHVHIIELIDDRRLIKIIKKGTDNNHFILESTNQKYDSSVISTDMIRSIWVVLAKYQKVVM